MKHEEFLEIAKGIMENPNTAGSKLLDLIKAHEEASTTITSLSSTIDENNAQINTLQKTVAEQFMRITQEPTEDAEEEEEEQTISPEEMIDNAIEEVFDLG